jgi:hypothetical protein
MHRLTHLALVDTEGPGEVQGQLCACCNNGAVTCYVPAFGLNRCCCAVGKANDRNFACGDTSLLGAGGAKAAHAAAAREVAGCSPECLLISICLTIPVRPLTSPSAAIISHTSFTAAQRGRLTCAQIAQQDNRGAFLQHQRFARWTSVFQFSAVCVAPFVLSLKHVRLSAQLQTMASQNITDKLPCELSQLQKQ